MYGLMFNCDMLLGDDESESELDDTEELDELTELTLKLFSFFLIVDFTGFMSGRFLT